MKLFQSISKLSSLIIQIVLVIILVAIFSYIDPFDILAPTKKKLKNTPIQVESIKEIGELITAEYYGEVITSLKEVMDEDLIEIIDSFNFEIDELHDDFIDAIDSIASLKLKRKDIYGKFINIYEDITTIPAFYQYAYYINEKIKDRNYRTRELKKRLSVDGLESLIKKLCWKKNTDERTLLANLDINEIKILFKTVSDNKHKKDLKRSRLVLIGRGWVKAGFDFGNFTERNFIYDEKRNRVVFIGLNPEIISATINPWFIPEHGVEGFEFVIVQRRVRHNPELTRRVKQRCLDKLEEQAMNKQILLQAQKNAENRLKNFFGLLLEDDEFNGVFFYTDYLEYSLEKLLEDNVIRNEEIRTIDTILNYVVNTEGVDFEIDKYKAFIDSLKDARTEIYDIPVQLNSKTSLLFDITQKMLLNIDGIDSSKAVSRVYESTVTDSIWNLSNKDEIAIPYNVQLTRENFINDLEKLKKELNLTFTDYVNDSI